MGSVWRHQLGPSLAMMTHGLPLRVTADYGGENALVSQYMLRHPRRGLGCGSFITGRSVQLNIFGGTNFPRVCREISTNTWKQVPGGQQANDWTDRGSEVSQRENKRERVMRLKDILEVEIESVVSAVQGFLVCVN